MKEKYLDLIEKVVACYSDSHIEKYIENVLENGIEEHGFPRLTANLGILIANGRRHNLKNVFINMMNICCREIPDSADRKEYIGNDFSVKEIVLCILELEEKQAVDGRLTLKWRDELSKIVPKNTYKAIATNPPSPINNWAAFGAASEQLRKFAKISDESDFINTQIASQLLSFDENGMYKDPHQPIVYDLVTRLQLSTAIYFGYRGEHYAALCKNLEKSAEITLKMQSVTGEIPYGGRSNQFLHNETFYCAICEFYAWYFLKKGDLKMAQKFKFAAKNAFSYVLHCLEKTAFTHVKNCFEISTMFGCEEYAYYDKYMVTAASWAYLAYKMCEDANPFDERENYVSETSEDFHKVFLKFGNYFAEYDYCADTKYDSTGLGRLHKKGVPSQLAISLPFAKEPNYRIDIKNGSDFSICGGSNNAFSYDDNTKVSLWQKEITKSFVSATFKCLSSEKTYYEKYILSDSGLKIEVEGDDIAIAFPVFEFDGTDHTKITLFENTIKTEYKGFACTYTSSCPITLTDELLANRNGHYLKAFIRGNKKISLSINLKEQ